MADDDNLIPEPVDNDDADETTTTDDTADGATETDADDNAGGGGTDDADSGEGDDAATKPDTIDWKAMARKWEKRAKENAKQAAANAEAKKRLDEAAETDKTEVDRLRESIEALQTENASNKLKALRADVSSRTGVPVELLTATTEDELNDQAEAISAFVAANTPATKPKPSTNGTKPKEKLRSGAQGGKPEMSREEIMAAVLGKGRKRATAK